jgi:hypothetical protein
VVGGVREKSYGLTVLLKIYFRTFIIYTIFDPIFSKGFLMDSDFLKNQNVKNKLLGVP